ncbi:MAG: EamA family transporter [Candidatus Heimdallarchaeota archaeon]
MGRFLESMSFDWFQVVFLVSISILSRGFGDFLYFWRLKRMEVSFVAGISNSYPLFALLFATLFRTEKLTSMSILTSAIIVS